MINFFLVTLVTYKNEIVKCSVTEFVIFPTIYRSKLFMELSTIISSMENEEILKKIYYIMKMKRHLLNNVVNQNLEMFY